MAEKAEEDPTVINEEDKEEKIMQHYSSFHQILLVGDGDFSFSLCLAQAFESASNIVASSLQPHGEVINMYKNGKSNLEKLKSLGGTVLHGVDATKIPLHPDLSNRKFDRIIYNFPHAGFHGSEDNSDLIQMHKNLVGRFLLSAKKMLRVDGQIHVTHKTAPPYDLWDLVGLGFKNSLICFKCTEFKIENYPGYNNKRGAGSKCDEPFHLGECYTFMFRFNPSLTNMPRTLHAPSRKIQKAPNFLSPWIYSSQKSISWIDNRNSPACVVNDVNGFPCYAYQNSQRVPNSISPPTHSFYPAYANDINGFPSPARHGPRGELLRIFKPHFSYVQETFGRLDVHVEVEVCRPLHRGALMSRDEIGRPSGDYFLNELRYRSPSRFLKLQQERQNLDRIRLIEQYGRGDYL